MSNYYELVDVYGDFDMNSYDENSSNRIITVFRRLLFLKGVILCLGFLLLVVGQILDYLMN